MEENNNMNLNMKEEKSSKNTILIVIIVILSLLLLGLSYYTFFVRDNSKIDDNKPIDEGQKLDNNSTEVKNLYDKLLNTSDFYENKKIIYSELNDREKLGIVASYLYSNKLVQKLALDQLKSCDDLDGYYIRNSKTKLDTNLNLDDTSTTLKDACEKSGGIKKFIDYEQNSTKTLFLNMFNVNKKMLNKNYIFEGNMPLVSFTAQLTEGSSDCCMYSKEKNEFLCYSADAYGVETSESYHFVQNINSAIKTKNEIVIYDNYNKFICKVNEKDSNISCTSTINDNETYSIEKSKNDDFESRDKALKEIKNISAGEKYKHIFKKDTSGNYYLYSSEPVNE